MPTKPRLIITISAILIVMALVIVGVTTKAQTSQTNAREGQPVSNSGTISFENGLQHAAQQPQQQVIGSDWVNGSTFGIITNDTCLACRFSIISYNGLVYIYYTELTPNSTAVIRGLVFNGTVAMKAPLPAFNDMSEAGPLLVRLDNGSLMMLWAGVPIGHYSLSNLAILLQASVLRNGAWGPVVNLTTSGIVISYASDGKYVYLLYTKPPLMLNNNVLEELTLTGVVVKVLKIPGVVVITGAWNGSVVVLFENGTYALVNVNTGAIEQLKARSAGFSGPLFYYFYNGTLTIVNGTQRLAISLPIYVDAFPVTWSHGLVIIAWRQGLLSAFNWNGTALQPIRNYTTTSIIVPRASIIDNTLYLAWFELVNFTNGYGYGSIYMAIVPLPYPTSQSTTTTTTSATTTTVSVTTTTSSASTSTTTSTSSVTASTSTSQSTTTTTTTSSTSTSSVTTPTTPSMTSSVKPLHNTLLTWVTASVAVIAAVALTIALSMSRRGGR